MKPDMPNNLKPKRGARSGRELRRPDPHEIVLFWAQVRRTSRCWLWLGGPDPSTLAYGQLRLNGRVQLAHRVAFAIEQGVVPAGAVVMHSCDNPRCVRPSHLTCGSQRENVLQSHARGRAASLPKGELNPAAKLTSEKVRELRRRYAAGEGTQGRLAEEYGITQSAACKIIRGDRYGDVA